MRKSGDCIPDQLFSLLVHEAPWFEMACTYSDIPLGEIGLLPYNILPLGYLNLCLAVIFVSRKAEEGQSWTLHGVAVAPHDTTMSANHVEMLEVEMRENSHYVSVYFSLYLWRECAELFTACAVAFRIIL